MAHPLSKNSTGWSPATAGGRLCNQRLWDQENSSHRLAIRRGMWMPWTSWNLAAFRWLAWLAAHFFSLFGSRVPPLYSSFLAAHSSYAALPFPVSAGGWYAYSPFLSWFPLLSVTDHYAQTFPGLCIISDVPCRSPICHHGFASLCTLSFIARLLTLKKVCRGAKKLTIIASSYVFLFVFLYSIYLFYFFSTKEELRWRHIKCYALALNHSQKLFVALYNLLTSIEYLKENVSVPSILHYCLLPKQANCISNGWRS